MEIYHNDNDAFGPVRRGQCRVHESGQNRVRGHGGQVSGIRSGLHQRYGAHGPVAAQIAREYQQPRVHANQVVVGQLSGRPIGHAGWIVEPATENRYYLHGSDQGF